MQFAKILPFLSQENTTLTIGILHGFKCHYQYLRKEAHYTTAEICESPLGNLGGGLFTGIAYGFGSLFLRECFPANLKFIPAGCVILSALYDLSKVFRKEKNVPTTKIVDRFGTGERRD